MTKKTITVKMPDLEERLIDEQFKKETNDPKDVTAIGSIEALKYIFTKGIIMLAESYKKHGCEADYGYIKSTGICYLIFGARGTYGEHDAEFIFKLEGIDGVSLNGVTWLDGQPSERDYCLTEPEQALDGITPITPLDERVSYVKYQFIKRDPTENIK